MAIDLTKLRHRPKTKWFHFQQTAAGIELTEDPDKAVMSLELEYMSRSEYRRFIATVTSERTKRRAVSRHGVKGIISDQEAVNRDVVMRVLKGWKMTVCAAVLLECEADFSGHHPTETIDFTDENIAFLCAHSTLVERIDALISDYDSWFEMNSPEEEEEAGKNSPSGPGGSTDESPAEPASAAI